MREAFDGVITLVLMIAAGWVLAKKGWFSKGGEDLLVKLALRVSVPCVLFINAVERLEGALSGGSALVYIAPVVSIVLSMLAAWGLCALFRVEKGRRGLTVSVFAMSNTIIIGLPVCTAVFGAGGVPFVMVYYLANTLLFWTVGVNLIASDGGVSEKTGAGLLKRVLSPAMVGFLAGAAVFLTRLPLPGPLLSAVSSVGGMNTPVCMLLVGASIARLGGREVFAFGRAGAVSLAGRLVLAPAITLLVCLLLRVQGAAASVFTLESAMPAMNQSVLIAKYYKADDTLASRVLSASALLMLVSVPLTVWVTGLAV